MAEEAAHVQILTAAGSREEAAVLAAALVEARLAACVQVVGPIQSTYWWEGRVDSAEEWLCLAKTTAALAEQAVDEIGRLHSYDTPEITVTPIVGGSLPYLAWIEQSVGDA
ncbi:MAG: divalent-cation tolerance protein CutA [Acidimicrobiales bacterium]